MNSLARAGTTFACTAIVALELIALAGWQGWSQARTAAQAVPARLAEPLPQPVHADAMRPGPQDRYYDQLRGKIRWVQTRMGDATLATPDVDSRMLLVKSAAQRAGLQEVGLGFTDVYGIINAETSWVPRTGASKDGTPNLGIAQFEPATARLLGMRDPNDAVESVHVAALHMKEAALWSAARLKGLKLGDDERAARLREGVSIYYNLSSRGRAAWNGRNTSKLPRETQLHIRNARLGALQAASLEAQLRQVRGYSLPQADTVLTASNQASGG